MTQVTFRGSPVKTAGKLPETGSAAPDFTLTKQDLSETKLTDYQGRRLILNIFPSLDTPTCATSVRQFNQRAAALENTVVLCVSMDLPFAQARFCGAAGIKNIETGSGFRSSFGEHYGVTMENGPLAGLYARAVIVIDVAGKTVYTQLVPEIADEPDYDAAIAALS
ncbi:MAG: thiol peroxidase [Kiritimatiellales bacterium]